MLRDILTQLANTLREEGAIDERESFIDVTCVAAKGGGEIVGLTKRGKGVKTLRLRKMTHSQISMVESTGHNWSPCSIAA
jgi:hypothetical protein